MEGLKAAFTLTMLDGLQPPQPPPPPPQPGQAANGKLPTKAPVGPARAILGSVLGGRGTFMIY